jgi:hypothetical protein
MLAAGAAYGQPSPVPAGPGGCPYGWAAVGSYCQPPQGAQGAVPIAPGGGCPYGCGGRLLLPAAPVTGLYKAKMIDRAHDLIHNQFPLFESCPEGRALQGQRVRLSPAAKALRSQYVVNSAASVCPVLSRRRFG